ncbi:MAG TPA: flavin prenyltransferase UbiX [Geobacteraceae bacterium]|nr:flavin prenyltransferase UbiX [Geobacteraceae bacterium]
MKGKKIVLAMTGASGAIYGLKLGKELLAAGAALTILLSDAGIRVIRHETALDLSGEEVDTQRVLEAYFRPKPGQLHYYTGTDFFAPVASGSSAPDAMVICPCTMGTLGRVACGNSGNLLERCADVMLKERRPLVLVPRETPLSEIHLENMLKLARLGARIVPAMPAFYNDPETIDDLVNFVVGKVLDSLGIENQLYRRWQV